MCRPHSKLNTAVEQCYLHQHAANGGATPIGAYPSGYPFWCVYSPYTAYSTQELPAQETTTRQAQWVGPVYGPPTPGVTPIASTYSPSWNNNIVHPGPYSHMFWCNAMPQGMPEHQWEVPTSRTESQAQVLLPYQRPHFAMSCSCVRVLPV